MKRNFAFFAIFVSLFASQLAAQEVASPERIIQKVAAKLAAVKMLGYKYSFEYSRPSQDRSVKDQSQAFLDLRPTDKSLRFRFQFSGVDRFSGYNGAERFTLDKKGKKIYVENKPSFESFGDMSLMNSPLALKYALPKIAADSSITKKVTQVRSGANDVYVIEFALVKSTLTAEGNIVDIRPDLTNIYRLTVDKKSLLPLEVIESNDKNDESIKTTYADITEQPELPAASSWFYSEYLKDYALQKKDKLTLIEPGKTAPDLGLAEFNSASKISLDQYKGKLVLVEFWITQCGFCIAAIPKLNLISRKFRDHGIEVVSVNMYDPDAKIEAFKNRHKPEFKILTGGDSIAAAYGVEAYPAIVLIDRAGKVAYSASGFFETEVESAIAANLKE